MATPIWIGCAKTNFHVGRGIYKPKAIVIHLAAGSLGGTDAWFLNPASTVSAHYCIGTSGTVHQYVKDSDTAYHTGVIHNPTWPAIIKGINPNIYTIGIEHEGELGDVWPEEQLQASIAITAGLCKEFSIPIDALHIIGHHEIYDGHACPGPGWNKQTYISRVTNA